MQEADQSLATHCFVRGHQIGGQRTQRNLPIRSKNPIRKCVSLSIITKHASRRPPVMIQDPFYVSATHKLKYVSYYSQHWH